MKNKQKTDKRVTLNGTEVHSVALDKNGIPMLGNKMNFLTISRETGSLKDSSKEDKPVSTTSKAYLLQ